MITEQQQRKPWELGIYDIEAARRRGTDLWWEKTGGVDDLREFQDGEVANAAVKKFIDYINRHSSDDAQTWGSPAYRKCVAFPVWKKVEQEVGL